ILGVSTAIFGVMYVATYLVIDLKFQQLLDVYQ
ncbi:DotU family type IV/VI secretion system protein, partial [Vibrio sp. 10N.286.51.A4]